MVHRKKQFSYNDDYCDLLTELERQTKMNKKFIDKLPQTDREVFEELGAEVVQSTALGLSGGFGRRPIEKFVGDEPRIRHKPTEKAVFIF
jgi:hypothetical protein